jgi:putative membrane protein
VLPQTLRDTPAPLALACAVFFGAAYFAVSFPDTPGASAGSYVSVFLISLPSVAALWRYLGWRRALLSLAVLSAFAYLIETIAVLTGLPYGVFHYGDSLGPKVAGLVPYLLPVSYVPLVLGAVAASPPARPRRGPGAFALRVLGTAVLLTLIDGVLDPGAASLGFWVWSGGGPYYEVPLSNYLGWLLSGAVAAALLLATGRWERAPLPGLLDSATIAVSFWTGVAAFSGLYLSVLLGAALLYYLLHRRSRLRSGRRETVYWRGETEPGR